MTPRKTISSAATLRRGQGRSPLVTAWDLYKSNDAFRFLLNFSVLGWLTLACLQVSNGLEPRPGRTGLFDSLPLPAVFQSAGPTANPDAPFPRGDTALAPGAAVGDSSPTALLSDALDVAHAVSPASPRLADFKAPDDAFTGAPSRERPALLAAAHAYNSGAPASSIAAPLAGLATAAPEAALMQGLAALSAGRQDQAETGLVLLSRAADSGLPAAMTAYGLARLSPPAALPADAAKGRQWLQRAADAGQAQAASLLARAYLTGAAGFVDRPKAEALLRQAHQLGDATAALRLAALIMLDRGAAGAAESEQLLRLAADRGELAAQAGLGRYLARTAAAGRGAGFEEADLWLTRAAERGDVQAMAMLGDIHLYFAKTPPVQNPALGVSWFKRCAEAGLPACHYALGRSYHLALGAAADPAQAWAHMSIARDHAVAHAQDELQQIDQSLTPAQRADGLRLLTAMSAH